MADGAAPQGRQIDDDRPVGVGTGPTLGSPRWLIPLAFGATLASVIGNLGGIALGDDGVGYRAIADHLLAGKGLGYFLEDPVTVWPPLWPALMAAVSKVTGLDTRGAAVVLNAVTVFLAVLLGYRLLRRTVRNARLELLGTLVIGLGSSTLGFSHLLMTDLAFAVVVMGWMLALMNLWDRDPGAAGDGDAAGTRWRWLLGAAALVWLGFGLRYVALYLVGLGGLWLLLDTRRRLVSRVRDAALYGAVCVVVPAMWMLRNHSVDGTFTGPRWASARGPLGNVFDVLSTMGRWILPGVADSALYAWAALAVVVLAVSAWLGWRVLRAEPPVGAGGGTLRRLVAWLGRPSGLLAVQGFGYLAYMVYVRSTTALNRLDLRLLNPAYLSLLALALVLVDRLRVLDRPAPGVWYRRGSAVVHVWAVANVAVGLAAVVMFIGGHSIFPGNYERQLFEDVRANPALDALPDGCRVYSNLPNALYPRLQARWSPMAYGIESLQPENDLQELLPTLDDRPACLVWIDEEPRYGNLWSLDDLGERLTLVRLASRGDVTVYRMEPPGR